MPVINNATVATGTGLSTAGNGGRKMVRLANGTFVSGVRATDVVNVYKSTDNGLNWSLGFARSATGVIDFAIQTNGERIFILTCNTGSVTFRSYDNQGNYSTNVNLDVQTSVGNVSLAINDAGTELHAAWSSKNGNYPNSFNIRYAKGVINGDGSVTWGAVEQVTTWNTAGAQMNNPVITLNKNSEPVIIHEYGGFNTIVRNIKTSTGWRTPTSSNNGVDSSTPIFNGGSHAQSNPSAIFVPTAINGLANGRLWVAWHGKDATDSAKFNVRVSYSDDGGVTWATPVKLTSGNTFDCQNVSLGADKNGKVFALYESHQWAPDIGIRMKTYNGSWGTEVGVATANTAEQYPSSLVDYSLMMTTPPTVYTDTTEGIKFVGNFNVGASVSPASGALGNKETATLTAYTVTPEAGSTVTSIVEKVNGVTVNTFNNPASLSRTLTVPTATWDTLAYFATHTASITVTDSNGATTVTTYSFDKRLATGASLLEATKANTDAKNRISTKRDALATQVGLSAGSTFDAIMTQLASGAFSKVLNGTGTVAGNLNFTYGDGSSSLATRSCVVAGLGFDPKVVLISAVSGTDWSVLFPADLLSTSPSTNTRRILLGTSSYSATQSTTVYSARLEGNASANNGFVLPTTQAQGGTFKWIAFG